MDPNHAKLQIAQELLNDVLKLVPPAQHVAAQALLTAADAKLQAVNATPPLPPLVAPQFTTPAAA